MNGRWMLIAAAAACMAAGSVPVASAQVPTADELQQMTGSADARTQADRLRALELSGTQTQIAQGGAVDPARYMLGPGDLLEVDLWGRMVRVIPLAVSPEGKVFLPGRGPLNVGGRSLEWARERILRQVAEVYTGVNADVRLVRLRTFKVYVSGLVKRAGAVDVNPTTRASEAIAEVGLGVNASRRNIEVRRLGGGTARLDLDLFENTGRQQLDPLLLDGDVIMVPRALRFADITGAVAYGGTFELAPGDSMSTLIDLAGGLLPSASPDRVLMVRFTSPTDRESLWVDAAAVSAGQGDFSLQDGDRVFVQFRPEYHKLPLVGIGGEVGQPGSYPIVPGRDRLTDLLGWAGGFRADANRSAIRLLRRVAGAGDSDPELDRLARLSRDQMTESEYTKLETMMAQRKNSFRVDWNRLQTGRVDLDPLLQDGDIVHVDRLVPSVRVEGQVKRPGYVDFAPGRKLGEYIRLAGGFTERSARSAVRVSRGITGQIVPARSLREVQPGDFVWVPERPDVNVWGVFRDIVTVAGQVAVIIFTLGR